MSSPAGAVESVPTFTVSAGSPTAEEIAVLVTVLMSLASVDSSRPTRRLRPWSSASWQRQQVTPVPGGWRLSGMRM